VSKYAPLADYLKAQAQDSVQLAFGQIDALVNGLPPSARNHDAWWANSRTEDSHTWAHLWIAAGWECESVNRANETAVFHRTSNRSAKPMQRYWWVNHKQTHLDEYAGGYIWSPKEKRNGAANQTYLNLTLVSPGDVVISYADGLIKAVGVASDAHREEPIPDSHWQAAEYWQALGWMVPIKWARLDHPISPKLHLDALADLLPEKHSPLQKNGDGNQGCYLASISVALGGVILGLVADRDLNALTTIRITPPSQVDVPGQEHRRLPAEQLRSVTPEYIWEAVQSLLQGAISEEFGPSIDYDLLVDEGKRLAPKQVFGLAATAALGFTLKPRHFTAGKGTVCFELLEAAGYKIVPKGEQVEALEIPNDTEDREWAEGQVKLVYHLKRERSPGLSKAKKASFIKKHGRLFCEECGTDPVEAYGDFGVACIEVHHEAIQVADMGEQHKTTLDQLRCLCANCHRVLHRKLKAQVVHPIPANALPDVMSAPLG